MSLFDRDRSAERVPVSLVTGFLGSGKTTLLNRLLADPGMSKSLVMVNEFGEIGLDHLFIESVAGDMVLMKSGCVCCSVRGDFERALRDAAIGRQQGTAPSFERVLVETTGLADPGPILELLLNWPSVSHDYRLDAVLCTVDAVNAMRQLDEHAEAARQAAVADRLLVTKADLGETSALEARLALLNPGAERHRVLHGEIAPEKLFGVAPTRSDALARWLDSLVAGGASHRERIATWCLESDVAIDWECFHAWLAAIRARWGDSLLRVKGILDVAGEAAPLVIHGVHRTFHPPTLLERWPEGPRRSRVVFILRDLDPQELERSYAQSLRPIR